MAVVSAARRPGRPAMVTLLAALLTTLGMLVLPHGQDPTSANPQPWGTDATADGAVVTVVVPVRTIGRLAAEPSPLGVHTPAGLLPLGTMPGATPSPTLMRLGGQHTSVLPRLPAAHRPTAGDRAPPARLSDR